MKSQEHAYEDSPNEEDVEHGEPLLDSDGKPPNHDTDSYSGRRIWSTRRSAIDSFVNLQEHWRLIFGGMLGIIIGLQLIIWHDIKAQSCENDLQLGGDYNRKGPISSS